jgi:8-oxo-dGTP pyrophosphatase MutT (NUDIX family)
MPAHDRARRDHTLRCIEAFDPTTEQSIRGRDLTTGLVRDSIAPFDRSQYHPGHITGSGLVFSPEGRRVLLVFHNRLQRWLQPGGHVEPSDPHVLATAVREVWEETGVRVASDSDPYLVSVDIHDIPANDREPVHAHHDLMFCLTAAGDAIDTSVEAREAVWCPIAELADYGVDGALLSGIERAFPASPPGRPQRR